MGVSAAAADDAAVAAPTLRGFNWQRSAGSPCRFLALSGHSDSACECAISGVKQILVFAAQMSANGPKRTSLVALHMSAFGGKADIVSSAQNVCF
jgi:hypothetical protein